MNSNDRESFTSKRALFDRLADSVARQTGESMEDIALEETVGQRLAELGISRRSFMKFCAGMASIMALPASIVPRMAYAVAGAKPSVIYMSFQECTGCLESLVNTFARTLTLEDHASAQSASIENLILNLVSLDYQETLMAAAGSQAEEWRRTAMQTPGYVLVVDGSIPASANSGYFVSAGQSGVARFTEAARNAAFVMCVGTCASFGGLPKAAPNPTGAVSIGDLMRQRRISKPLINVSGCPPIAEVITGVIMYYLTFNKLPPLDSLKRPTMFYGETVHDECYRKEFFERGLFAEAFDDAGARRGYCLLHLGCKGPVTHNACSTVKWNQGTSFPMQSGHGCLGCAEPNFWDSVVSGEKGFYRPLPPGSFSD